MNILLCGGRNTVNLQKSLVRKFDSGNMDFIVLNNIKEIESLFERGNDFDRAILFEESWTNDGTDRDVSNIRTKIINFVETYKIKCKKSTTLIFVCNTSDMADIINDEIIEISSSLRIVLRTAKMTIAFISTLVTSNLDLLPNNILYKRQLNENNVNKSITYSNKAKAEAKISKLNSAKEVNINDLISQVRQKDEPKELINDIDLDTAFYGDTEIDEYSGLKLDSSLFGVEIPEQQTQSYQNNQQNNQKLLRKTSEDANNKIEVLADKVTKHSQQNQQPEQLNQQTEQQKTKRVIDQDKIKKLDTKKRGFFSSLFGSKSNKQTPAQIDNISAQSKTNNQSNQVKDTMTQVVPEELNKTPVHYTEIQGIQEAPEEFEEIEELEELEEIEEPEEQKVEEIEEPYIEELNEIDIDDDIAEPDNQIVTETKSVYGDIAEGNQEEIINYSQNTKEQSNQEIEELISFDLDNAQEPDTQNNNQDNQESLSAYDDIEIEDEPLEILENQSVKEPLPLVTQNNLQQQTLSKVELNKEEPVKHQENLIQHQEIPVISEDSINLADFGVEDISLDESEILDIPDISKIQSAINIEDTYLNGIEDLYTTESNNEKMYENSEPVQHQNNSQEIPKNDINIEKQKTRRNLGKAKSSRESIENNTERLNKIMSTYRSRGCSIVFTGTSFSGKTVVSYNIAKLIAELGYQVLLVDFDTRNKSQGYINIDNFNAVHSLGTKNASLIMAINKGNNLMNVVNIIAPGLHLLTLGLASDTTNIENLVQKQKIARFSSNVRTSYNFIVYDLPFDYAVGHCNDITVTADNTILLTDYSTKGFMDTLIALANIEDDELMDTMFSTTKFCFNKFTGYSTMFNKKVRRPSDILNIMDNKIRELLGVEPEYLFSNMNLITPLNFDTRYSDCWFSKQSFIDFTDGRIEYTNLLGNILLNNWR